MGKLNSNVGNALLGAAIIDDILGIIALSVVSSFADTCTSQCYIIKNGIILRSYVLFAKIKIGLWIKKISKDK
ncbi:MAG: cation:proton antiporter [Paeniclostridium sp.]